jgi:electron transport complex protein RnfG
MKEILRLCYVLTIIGAVCAVAMSFVDQKTKGPITEFRKDGAMEAAKALMPPYDNDPVKDAFVCKLSEKDSTVFFRFKKGGTTIGAAFSVIAPSGYAGNITILIAVDSAAVVRGIEIIQQQETPGLGSKIALPFFKGQFKGKSINNPAQWAVMRDGGTFRQVTGATISSRAVTTAVAGGLELLESVKAEVLGSDRAATPQTATPRADSPQKPEGGKAKK